MIQANLLNSNWLLAAIVFIPLLIGFLVKRKHFLNLFLPAQAIVVFLVQTIKKLTAQPRPFFTEPQVLGVATNLPSDYSFPSLHTALGTLFAWTLSFIYPKLSWVWFGILTIVAYSRIALGLHYSRDIVAGFFLASLVFWSVFLLSQSKKAINWARNINIRRKVIHLFYGLMLVFLLDYQVISRFHFFIWLLISLAIVLVSPMLPAKLRGLINFFEREKQKKYLALEPFLFTLSSFIVWLVFPKYIAIAAILNLSIGDSVNALTGSFLTHKKKKRISAAAAAFFATLLISGQYVSLVFAFTGSLATAVFEYSEPRIKGKKIDDNLLIPLVSGGAMYLLKLLTA